ncbi:hypothetical protein [Vibrio phage phiKT1028]|nr:hypothetical protein [Vibrio phage phiKT1028]
MKRNVVQGLRILAGMETLEPAPISLEAQVKLEDELADQRADNEIIELAKDIDESVEELQEREELEQELTEVVDGMEFLLKNNNPQAFGILYARANRIHVKLGGQCTLPRGGMESIDARRIEAHAIVGMESFMDTLKNGVEIGKDLIRRAFQFLMDLWSTVMSSESRTKRKIEDLKARLEKNGLKEKVKLGDWAHFYPKYSTLSEEKIEALKEGNEGAEAFESFFTNLDGKLNSQMTVVQHCIAMHQGIKSYFSLPQANVVKNGDYLHLRAPLVNGYRVLDKEIDDTYDAIDFLNSIRVLPPMTEKPNGNEVPRVFDEEMIKNYLNEFLPETMDKLKNAKSVIKETKDNMNRLIGKEQDPITRKIFKAYLTAVVNVYSGNLRETQRILNNELEMVKAHIA